MKKRMYSGVFWEYIVAVFSALLFGAFPAFAAFEDLAPHRMVAPEIGYIRIPVFTDIDVMPAINKAIFDLRKKGMKYLIWDVIDNPGGYLRAAVFAAAKYAESADEIIIYVESETGHPLAYESSERGELADVKSVVLVSQGTASAAEIFARFVQKKSGRVISYDSHTYGKYYTTVINARNEVIRHELYRFADGSWLGTEGVRVNVVVPHADRGDDGANLINAAIRFFLSIAERR